MGLWLQILGYVAAFTLQILVLQAMRNGAWRRYPFVFLYVTADLITNVIEAEPNLRQDTGSAGHRWAIIFWADERIMHALLFLMVISLIYRASADSGPRRTFVAFLICGSVLAALLSLAIHFDPALTTGRWMTKWTRDMFFGAAILDLILWATLIKAKRKDQVLLMVAGALGLQVTANAIGSSLRDLSHWLVDATSFVMVCANLTCLFVWWHAFKLPTRAANRNTPPAPDKKREP